jgi:hypothetical protein
LIQWVIDEYKTECRDFLPFATDIPKRALRLEYFYDLTGSFKVKRCIRVVLIGYRLPTSVHRSDMLLYRLKTPPGTPEPEPLPKPDPEPEPGSDPDIFPAMDPLPEPLPM